ncbi:uncharacterized protein LOC141865994 isoform X2 [Acropora palmata]|uniref:uncharacterized protein LOC141865994 isoform X2 n=1 Tax=Acropora palmata TaxID=6131 RepID=UPI003DA10C26
MAFVSQKRTSVGKWLLVQSLMALTAAVFLCKAHQDCYNGGTWKNGTCLCNDGFTGKFCEKGVVPNPHLGVYVAQWTFPSAVIRAKSAVQGEHIAVVPETAVTLMKYVSMTTRCAWHRMD